MTVIKRDGEKVDFDISKIANAIFKAAASIGGADKSIAGKLAIDVCDTLKDRDTVTVEEIQDTVEKILIANNYDRTAKAYILYRDQRTKVREGKSHVTKMMEDLTYSSSSDMEIKRENGNINADTSAGMMYKYGSEISKWYSLEHLIRPEIAKLHKEHTIHIHDLDYFSASSCNCAQIPVGSLLKTGFHTGHGFIRPPKSITTAATQTAIIIQSNQNEMFK